MNKLPPIPIAVTDPQGNTIVYGSKQKAAKALGIKSFNQLNSLLVRPAKHGRFHHYTFKLA